MLNTIYNFTIDNTQYNIQERLITKIIINEKMVLLKKCMKHLYRANVKVYSVVFLAAILVE